MIAGFTTGPLPLSEPQHVGSAPSGPYLYPGQFFFPIPNMIQRNRLEDDVIVAIMMDNGAGFRWGGRIPQ